MKIKNVFYSAGLTGFFFDDQRAIKRGAEHDGFTYVGDPVTPGFSRIRQAGESISIIIELENGRLAWGDAAAVQYSGAGGRDPLMLAENYIPFLQKNISPLLVGMELDSFRRCVGKIEKTEVDGKRLHTGLRYGLSQALLAAKAEADGKLMCEVLCDEYDLPVVAKPVPIFGQSGDDRYTNVDKMIIKHVDVLPHALINTVEKFNGLEEYIAWLVKRIGELRTDPAYHPTLHIDLYGMAGIVHKDLREAAACLAKLQDAAGDFELYFEGPVDMEAKLPQIDALGKIRAELRRLGSPVKIVADEWCNTLEDIRDFTDAQCCDMVQIKTPDLGGIQNTLESVLYCREHGMEAYQGGTCNETDISARSCVHVAMAGRPVRILAKPGMGFDEGFEIVKNEMSRTIAILKRRNK